jgi:phosphoribosylformylglycinamidine cyclo-ligase
VAHITGGGLTENIPRVLPPEACAKLELAKWPRSKIFQWVKKYGSIDEAEMHRTFNCGIGMVMVVAKGDVKETLDVLAANGAEAFEVGSIVARGNGAPQTVVV